MESENVKSGDKDHIVPHGKVMRLYAAVVNCLFIYVVMLMTLKGNLCPKLSHLSFSTKNERKVLDR